MESYSASPQGGYYQAPHHERNDVGANARDAANAPNTHDAANAPNAPNTRNPHTDAPSSWTSEPSVFIATFGRVPQALIDEHEQCVKLLAGPTPLELQRPAIVELPRPGGDEERALFRDVCLHIASYTDATKKAVLLQQEPSPDEAVNLTLLAMATFRYPPKAQTALQLFGRLTKCMLQAFSHWWRADSRITAKIRSSQQREQRAANLKKEALAILRVNLEVNSESRWLFALLRTLGHIPELWEGSNPHPDPNAEVPQASAPGMSNSQHTQVAQPMHDGVPRTPQVPTPAPFPAPVSVSDSFYTTATTVRRDIPLAFQPRTAVTTSQPQQAPSWGQGAPSVLYRTGSEGWEQSQFSQRQPTPPVIPEASMRDASPFTFQQPTQTHPFPVPASTPAMPTLPSNVRDTRPDTITNPQFMLHRGGSGSLHSVNSYSSRESRTQTPNTSSPRPQRPPSDLDALIVLERVRLIQMEFQLEKLKQLAEFFYRALYLELSRYFTESHLCSIYRNMISGLATTLDSLTMQMYLRLTRDLAFLSKYV